jgi:hypothetical protein
MSDSLRSSKIFGVAGLLNENCTIYYANHFKSRSMGRLADLMAAKLREVQADELKLRAVLLFGLFDAYAAIGKNFNSNTDLPAVQLEVGVDGQQVAVGLSFQADFSYVGIEEIDRRVNENLPANSFEELLIFAKTHCSQMILRYEKNESRMEIVTLLSFDPLEKAHSFMVIEVDATVEPLLGFQNYVEIGDLNYIDLTRESDIKSESIDESRTNSAEIQDQSLIVVTGESGEETSEPFEQRFSTEAAPSEETSQVVPGNSEEVYQEPDGQIWPFQPEPVEAESAVVVNEESKDEGDDAVVIPSHLNPEETLQKIHQIATATSETLQRQVMPDTGGQSPDEKRFRNWADGLVKEITKERAQLHELTKNASKQVRQREMEFKNRERALKADLRLKDEQIRQKDTLLDKKLEQFSQLALAHEKLKISSSAGKETSLKSKLTMTQKLLQMKTDEIKSISQKMKALEDRLMVAQSKSSKPIHDPELLSRLAGSERKLEEYKRLNQRLMESLNQPKEKVDSQETQDLRRKLEMLDRQYIEAKKSLEKQAFKMREMQENERKTQSDMQRVIDENRKLRQSNKNEAA